MTRGSPSCYPSARKPSVCVRGCRVGIFCTSALWGRPPADRAFSALLEDLDCRGLLDETLVIWMGEFGRTPRINQSAGRDHWGGCLSVVLAGAGIRGGQVYGAFDRQAAYPAALPVSAQDLMATILSLPGDRHRRLRPGPGRPAQSGLPWRAGDGAVPLTGCLGWTTVASLSSGP
jgi:hypothetical protein